MQFIDHVKTFVEKHHLLSRDGIILVAVSGGADSMALVLTLREMGYATEVLHCNFHLRGEESDRDERFVRTWCEKHGVPLKVKDFATKEVAENRGISIEMAARDLRYEWFHSELERQRAQCIAVAHHKDDQAETLLLNLTRGTGLRGLAGMWPRQGQIVRPLLCVSRQDILNYLEAKGETFVNDSTNQEREARRNILRLDVIPMLAGLNPQIKETLCHTADIMQQSLFYYKQGVECTLKAIGATDECLPIEGLKHTENPLLLLHEWLDGKGFNGTQEQDIINNLEGQSGTIFSSKTHRLLHDRTCLMCKRIDQKDLLAEELTPNGQTQLTAQLCIEASWHETTASLPRTPDYAWIDGDKLHEPLKVRYTKPGDSFIPFGMKGRRLVSDFLTDLKVNRFEKERQLVVTQGEDIIWVVGRRPDNRFRIDTKSKNILLLHIMKTSFDKLRNQPQNPILRQAQEPTP